MTSMKDAQRAYDNRSPDDVLDPLDCPQVASWIDSYCDALLGQRDVKLGSVVIVSVADFAERIATSAIAYRESGLDEGNLGRLILSALDFEPSHAHGYAVGIFAGNNDHCRDIAKEMLEPFAKQILEQIIEENREDCSYD